MSSRPSIAFAHASTCSPDNLSATNGPDVPTAELHELLVAIPAMLHERLHDRLSGLWLTKQPLEQQMTITVTAELAHGSSSISPISTNRAQSSGGPITTTSPNADIVP